MVMEKKSKSHAQQLWDFQLVVVEQALSLPLTFSLFVSHWHIEWKKNSIAHKSFRWHFAIFLPEKPSKNREKSHRISKLFPNWIWPNEWWLRLWTIEKKTYCQPKSCIQMRKLSFFSTHSVEHQTNYIPICFMVFKILHTK